MFQIVQKVRLKLLVNWAEDPDLFLTHIKSENITKAGISQLHSMATGTLIFIGHPDVAKNNEK